jgi:hypothetical protein
MTELAESWKQKQSAKAVDNPELPKRKKTPTPCSHRPQASSVSKAQKLAVKKPLDEEDRVVCDDQQSREHSPP